MNGGDVLASGRAKSAQFTVSEKISQERWDKIWQDEKEKPAEPKKPLKKVWSK